MNSRTRTTDIEGFLNKLKCKSLKCLKRQQQSKDEMISGQASFLILKLLTELEN